MRAGWPLILASTAIMGCAGSQAPPPTPVAAAPAISQVEAKKLILANKSRLWRDPDSIRDASIGAPHTCIRYEKVPGQTLPENQPRNCICLELNARNASGGYAGMSFTIISFPNSGGPPEADNLQGDHCNNFTPFPELNARLRR